MNRRLFDPSQLYAPPDYVEDTLRSPPHNATALAFNNSGTMLAAGCEDGSVVLWDYATRSPLKVLQAPMGTSWNAAVMVVAWSRDGRLLVAGCRSGSIACWNVANGSLASTTQLGTGLTSISTDDKASVVAALPDTGPVQIIQLATGVASQLPTITAEAEAKPAGKWPASCAVMSRNGQVVLVGQSRGIIIAYDVATFNVLDIFKVPGTKSTTRVSQLVGSRGGDLLAAVCSDRVVRLLRLDVSAASAPGEPLVSPLDACAVLVESQGSGSGSLLGRGSSDGTGGGGGGQVRLLAHQRDLAIQGEAGPAVATFHMDSEHLVAAPGHPNRDHLLYIYEVATGAVVTYLTAPGTGPPVTLASHPHHTIASATADGQIFIWGREYRENWSAFAPSFRELAENEEYNEREDEFDSNPRADDVVAKAGAPVEVGSDTEVDILAGDGGAGYSDDDGTSAGAGALVHLPIAIRPDPELLQRQRERAEERDRLSGRLAAASAQEPYALQLVPDRPASQGADASSPVTRAEADGQSDQGPLAEGSGGKASAAAPAQSPAAAAAVAAATSAVVATPLQVEPKGGASDINGGDPDPAPGLDEETKPAEDTRPSAKRLRMD